jgi:ABC-2 type transport system permease protein
MRQFNTVFKFEFMSYFGNKRYLITTVVLVCLTLLLGIIPAVLSAFGVIGGDPNELDEAAQTEAAAEQEDLPKIGIYDKGNTLSEENLDAYLGQGRWARLDHADAGDISEAVLAAEYSLVLEVDGLNYTITMPGSETMRFYGGVYNELVKVSYQAALLRDRGLDHREAEEVLGVVALPAYVFVGKDLTESYWLGYLMILILYIAILIYGSYVMTSVITEKTSKTVELLVVSVKPVYLMFGKVVGAGAAGLVQLCVLILTGVISLNIFQRASGPSIPFLTNIFNSSSVGITLFYALVFFLLGFFGFAFLYAAFASTVSRLEDANTVTMFPMIPFIAAFFIALTGMQNPAAAHVVACSYIPLLSPMVMFMRICVTDIPLYQTLLAIAVNIITVAGVGAFSAKLYRVGVLMYGAKPTFRNTWRSFRQS